MESFMDSKRIAKEFEARMTLMEGKEFKYGLNIPGDNKIEILKRAITSLQDYLKRMEEDNDETNEEGRFNLEVQLFKYIK